jgi:hypothetical protein
MSIWALLRMTVCHDMIEALHGPSPTFLPGLHACHCAQTHVKTKVNRHVFQALAHDRYTTPASMPLSASPTKSYSPRFRLSCSDLSNQWRPKRLPETAPHSRMVWELCMAWLNTSSPIIVSGSWLSFAQKQLVFQTPARMAMSQLRR